MKSATDRVKWGDVRIYVFPNLLGDNPAASDDGAPLTIGWKHESKKVIDVDSFEDIRQNKPKRKRKDLIIPGPSRDLFLLKSGYRLEELLSVAEETKRIRKSRQASLKGTPWSKFKNIFDHSVWPRPFRPRTQTSEPKTVCAKSG
jgi:hypothetical protein